MPVLIWIEEDKVINHNKEVELEDFFSSDFKVDVSVPAWPHEYESFIKSEALVRTIKKGEFHVDPAS